MQRMSSPASLSSQKDVTNNRPTNYYDDLFDFARVYAWLIGKSKSCQKSTPLKVDNVNVVVDDDDVVYYLMSRRDVRLRQHEIKSKKTNLKKK
jgi:hypothetical protein